MNESVWLNPQNLGPMLVNLLAVAGGFLVGAVLAQVIVTTVVRYVTLGKGKVPGWVLWGMRLMGGVVVAWLVALFVFGSGSGWWPGLGGGGGGTGTGKEGGTGTGTAHDTAPGKDTGKSVGSNEPDAVRVEVLNIEGTPKYRIQGEAALKTLEEVKAIVERRLQEPPPRRPSRLEIILYLNSPDQSTLPVQELKNWAILKELTPAVTTPKMNAP